jgi:hypothetical protein
VLGVRREARRPVRAVVLELADAVVRSRAYAAALARVAGAPFRRGVPAFFLSAVGGRVRVFIYSRRRL